MPNVRLGNSIPTLNRTMATTTEKRVTRVTVDAYPVLYYGKPRQIVVTVCRMGADDMLEFREKGTRSHWFLPVDEAFKFAVRRKAVCEQLVKARAKKEAKERGRHRKHRP